MATTNPGTRIVTKIIFPVADMTEAMAFYERLGFEVEGYSDSYAWVTSNGSEVLHLTGVSGPYATNLGRRGRMLVTG
jgi:catechol-2,3-dioxygenase